MGAAADRQTDKRGPKEGGREAGRIVILCIVFTCSDGSRSMSGNYAELVGHNKIRATIRTEKHLEKSY